MRDVIAIAKAPRHCHRLICDDNDDDDDDVRWVSVSAYVESWIT